MNNFELGVIFIVSVSIFELGVVFIVSVRIKYILNLMFVHIKCVCKDLVNERLERDDTWGRFLGTYSLIPNLMDNHTRGDTSVSVDIV